jgi:hypothetical protein
MIKTADQLKEQAKKIGLTRWVVRRCSMCDYPLAYYFSVDYERVKFDSGCDCVNYSHEEERSWENLAESYNMNQPENNPKISKEYLEKLNKIWQFEEAK